jgi:hypothetical protein
VTARGVYGSERRYPCSRCGVTVIPYHYAHKRFNRDTGFMDWYCPTCWDDLALDDDEEYEG